VEDDEFAGDDLQFGESDLGLGRILGDQRRLLQRRGDALAIVGVVVHGIDERASGVGRSLSALRDIDQRAKEAESLMRGRVAGAADGMAGSTAATFSRKAAICFSVVVRSMVNSARSLSRSLATCSLATRIFSTLPRAASRSRRAAANCSARMAASRRWRK